jgi:hypothetical protein
MHEQRVRIQRLALADVSTSAVVIGKAVQQVTVVIRSITPTITSQSG